MSVTTFPYIPREALAQMHAAAAAVEGTTLPAGAEVHATVSIHLESATEVDMVAAQWKADGKLAAKPAWGHGWRLYKAAHSDGVEVMYVPRAADVAPFGRAS